MSEKKDVQKPVIIPAPNGPYLSITDLTPRPFPGLSNSRGEKPSNTTYTALCRCGQSENKPFCDGTHWQIGFTDEKN